MTCPECGAVDAYDETFWRCEGCGHRRRGVPFWRLTVWRARAETAIVALLAAGYVALAAVGAVTLFG